MKRQIQLSKQLPAFSLTLVAFADLWTDILALFNSNERLSSIAAFKVPNEELEFETVAEMLAYTKLKGEINNFSIKVSQGNRSVQLTTHAFIRTRPLLEVEGEDHVWCVSAVATVEAVINQSRVWYWWFYFWPFFSIAIIWLLTPMVVVSVTKVSVPNNLVNLWEISLGMLWLVGACRDRLMRASMLVVEEERGFFRRYLAEISFAVSLALGLTGIYLTLR